MCCATRGPRRAGFCFSSPALSSTFRRGDAGEMRPSLSSAGSHTLISGSSGQIGACGREARSSLEAALEAAASWACPCPPQGNHGPQEARQQAQAAEGPLHSPCPRYARRTAGARRRRRAQSNLALPTAHCRTAARTVLVSRLGALPRVWFRAWVLGRPLNRLRVCVCGCDARLCVVRLYHYH
eukprot:scaffold209318_cov28-Tisochrysis_lutea.AAC.2